MRESEEYLEDETYDSWYTEENQKIVHKFDAEHAVKLAYKEGYLEARADILEELRGNDTELFMMSAIIRVKNMKLPENLFK